jgi:hypothetical protein
MVVLTDWISRTIIGSILVGVGGFAAVNLDGKPPPPPVVTYIPLEPRFVEVPVYITLTPMPTPAPTPEPSVAPSVAAPAAAPVRSVSSVVPVITPTPFTPVTVPLTPTPTLTPAQPTESTPCPTHGGPNNVGSHKGECK